MLVNACNVRAYLPLSMEHVKSQAVRLLMVRSVKNVINLSLLQN